MASQMSIGGTVNLMAELRLATRIDGKSSNTLTTADAFAVYH
jgi:hypothetical protein